MSVSRVLDLLGGAAKTVTGTLTLHFSLVRNCIDWNRCDQIIPGLHVSVLPQESQLFEALSNSKEDILNYLFQVNPSLPLGCVVSFTEDEEIQNGRYLFVKTVTPKDWTDSDDEAKDEEKVEHILVNMKDFQAKTDKSKLFEALKMTDKHRKQGRAVIYHCKAGRSRSMFGALCYLVTHVINPETAKKFEFEEAHHLLKAARKQEKLDDANLLEAYSAINGFNKSLREEKEIKITPELYEVALANYLASKQVKAQILQLESITALKQYALQAKQEPLLMHLFKCDRAAVINKFIELIERPDSEAWFFNLFIPNGSLTELRNAKPKKSSEALMHDKTLREKLVQDAKDQVFSYVATSFLYMGKTDIECLTMITKIAEGGRIGKKEKDLSVSVTEVPCTLYPSSCAVESIEKSSDKQESEVKSAPRLTRIEA